MLFLHLFLFFLVVFTPQQNEAIPSCDRNKITKKCSEKFKFLNSAKKLRRCEKFYLERHGCPKSVWNTITNHFASIILFSRPHRPSFWNTTTQQSLWKSNFVKTGYSLYRTGWWPPIGGCKILMGPQRPNLTNLDPVFLQKVGVNMDSGNDFFLRASHSLFWASKLAIFLGFVTFPELRAVSGIEGCSNEIVVFTLIQWSMLIKIVMLLNKVNWNCI